MLLLDSPAARVTIEAGQLRISVPLARAGIGVPPGCLLGGERVFLTTALTVDDGSPGGDVELTATQPCICKALNDGHRAGLSHQVGGCAQFLAESSAVLRKALASPRPPVGGSALTVACPDPE